MLSLLYGARADKQFRRKDGWEEMLVGSQPSTTTAQSWSRGAPAPAQPTSPGWAPQASLLTQSALQHSGYKRGRKEARRGLWPREESKLLFPFSAMCLGMFCLALSKEMILET